MIDRTYRVGRLDHVIHAWNDNAVADHAPVGVADVPWIVAGLQLMLEELAAEDYERRQLPNDTWEWLRSSEVFARKVSPDEIGRAYTIAPRPEVIRLSPRAYIVNTPDPKVRFEYRFLLGVSHAAHVVYWSHLGWMVIRRIG